MKKPIPQEHLMASEYVNIDGEVIQKHSTFQYAYCAVRFTDNMRYLPCFSTAYGEGGKPYTCDEGRRAVFLMPTAARKWLLSRMVAYKEIAKEDKANVTDDDIKNMGYEFVIVYSR